MSLLRGLVGWFGLRATLSLIGRTGPTLGFPLSWSCYFRTVLWPDGSLWAPETVPSGAWWGLSVLWIKFRASCMISMCSVTWTISPISPWRYPNTRLLYLHTCLWSSWNFPPPFDWGICTHPCGRLHASLRHTTVICSHKMFSHLHVRVIVPDYGWCSHITLIELLFRGHYTHLFFFASHTCLCCGQGSLVVLRIADSRATRTQRAEVLELCSEHIEHWDFEPVIIHLQDRHSENCNISLKSTLRSMKNIVCFF